MILALLIILLTPTVILSATAPVKFGGFVDAYFAYDFNDPKKHERVFTTQPVQHKEFDLNLAHVDAVLNQEKTRGRLALQYGNSVTKNTKGESELKVFQEAYVGKKLGNKTWLDAGLFFGNIGAESWISKDNWTYSRALNLDFVPYYSAGVRMEHQFDSTHSGQIQILNGWQNISENNRAKAIGMQFKKLLDPRWTFIYNNFFGDEEVVPNPQTGKFRPRFRSYHNFIFRFLYNERWSYLAAVDLGHQAQQNNRGTDAWGAATLTIRRILDEKRALALRMEYYTDPHQANVVTGTPHGFQVKGASLNYDQKISDYALWRTEVRGFESVDRIYPRGTKYQNRLDGFLVTSLSLWF